MNRRGFLKLCGMAASGTMALPSLSYETKPKENPYMPGDYKKRIDQLTKTLWDSRIRTCKVPKQYQWPEKFDPTKGCSHGVRYPACGGVELAKKAKVELVKNMKSYVPVPYRKHVEYISKQFHYGEVHAITWIYEPPNRRPA